MNPADDVGGLRPDHDGPSDGPPRDDSRDERSFEALARQVIEPVRRYLARRTDSATAADVLSEVLLVLWRRLDDVPADEPLPYAYTVARHCLQNAQRSGVRQERLAARIAVVDPPPQSVAPHHDESDHLDVLDGRGVDAEDVRRAVAALPPASAEVVRLWAWEQLTPAQIAPVVGSTANAVSIRLHRAKKQLASALGSTPPPEAPAPGRKTTPGAGHEQDEERRTT